MKIRWLCFYMIHSKGLSATQLNRVTTNLENMENLENSGNLKNRQSLGENLGKSEFLQKKPGKLREL